MSKAIQPALEVIRRYIEAHADEPLPLAELSKKSGYSAAHLQKAFTEYYGSSPKAYQLALRRSALKRALKSGAAVADAIYDCGFSSPSRVYESLDQSLGMTPHQYRSGGERVVIHHASGKTVVGEILIGATHRGICYLQFGAGMQSLEEEFPQAQLVPMPAAQQPAFEAWLNAINGYLEGRIKTPSLPLDVQGTAFQLMVWRYLQTIPRGEVRSYSEVAAAIGKPDAVRAVGTACGRNNVSILIPCHRVLRGDGHLGGYRWGVQRKEALLALEKKP